mmetsp:Transcript_76085/g.126814  ORF Transcript_76085/g.126814 Transcript_76085/m.126814 type:complete len:92 (-) Transcript_76085:210-485(-)
MQHLCHDPSPRRLRFVFRHMWSVMGSCGLNSCNRRAAESSCSEHNGWLIWRLHSCAATLLIVSADCFLMLVCHSYDPLNFLQRTHATATML